MWAWSHWGCEAKRTGFYKICMVFITWMFSRNAGQLGLFSVGAGEMLSGCRFFLPRPMTHMAEERTDSCKLSLDPCMHTLTNAQQINTNVINNLKKEVHFYIHLLTSKPLNRHHTEIEKAYLLPNCLERDTVRKRSVMAGMANFCFLPVILLLRHSLVSSSKSDLLILKIGCLLLSQATHFVTM